VQNRAAVLLEAPASGPVRSWTFEGSGRVWGYTPGMSVWSSPALGVVEDRALLLVGSYDKNLYALDAASGEQRWRFTTGGGVYSAPLLWRDGDHTLAFAAASDRLVYGLDAALGRRVWIHSVQPFRPTLGGARLSAPCLGEAQGRPALFVGHWVWDRSLKENMQEGGLRALDARSGELLWSRLLGDNQIAPPIFGRVDGAGMVFVGSSNGNLYAVEADSGELRWQHTELDAIRGAPALASSGGRSLVVVASKYGLVRALDAASGEERWRYKTGDRITGAPMVFEVAGRALVVIGSYDRTLYALDLASGAPVWRYWTRGGIFASPALVATRPVATVLTTSWDHHLHGVSASDGAFGWLAYTGRPLWDTLGLGDSTWASPAAARINGEWMAYTGSYDGMLYGLAVAQVSQQKNWGERSNLAFWVSLPLSLGCVAGLALVLTRRQRRRERA